MFTTILRNAHLNGESLQPGIKARLGHEGFMPRQIELKLEYTTELEGIPSGPAAICRIVPYGARQHIGTEMAPRSHLPKCGGFWSKGSRCACSRRPCNLLHLSSQNFTARMQTEVLVFARYLVLTSETLTSGPLESRLCRLSIVAIDKRSEHPCTPSPKT